MRNLTPLEVWEEHLSRQDIHSQYTSVQYSSFTSAERIARAWLKSHGLHFIFVRLKRSCRLVLHMSHPWLTHLPFATSTSSSSFTLPSTTTQEHAAQPVQDDQVREHPAHHAHLQAPSVHKLRRQESLWRENLQSGGNPHTTTPQVMSPKSLRLSQGSKIMLEVHINYMTYWKIQRRRSPSSWPGGWGHPRGSRTCVCANTFGDRVTPQGGEGRMNVLPWYRPVAMHCFHQNRET